VPITLAAPLLLASALTWLDPAAVTPGQKGVCVTEWSGGQRIEIPVEVLGVLDATGPDKSAVLVRLADDRFAGTGVVAGMSGSPVYVDGKLLGAVAFGWSFAREPLGGVTPFAAMHAIAGGPSAPASPPTLTSLASISTGDAPLAAVLPRLAPPAGRALPLAVAGFDLPGGYGRELLATAGLEPVPAGGGPGPAGVPEAGDMVAALLVWGDATLAAGGTVTARDGDRVWAFGHPMFSLGGIRVPAARARTLAVQSSYQSSFKVFTVGAPFGTFVADRAPGILAIAGASPAGLPVAVHVSEPLGERTWRFRVAEVPLLEPLLVTFLTNACLTARGAGTGESTVHVTLTLELADGRSASIGQASRGVDALARIATFTGAAVSFVENSPFPRPALAGVDVRLRRSEAPEYATITDVWPARSTVRPGEELAVTARLAPFRGDAREVSLTLRLPAGIPPGPADLIVGDGAAFTDYRLKAAAVAPADFAGQLAQLSLIEPNTTLVAAIETRERGIALNGTSQPALPPSYAATLMIGMGKSNAARLQTAIVADSRWSAPFPLEGAFRIPITVRPPAPESP
jgi:hypothetical protein